MALAVFLLLIVPTVIGIFLDARLKIWPWGILAALIFGILAATIFIVRYTFNAYRRIEEAHASTSAHTTSSLVKEDERA